MGDADGRDPGRFAMEQHERAFGNSRKALWAKSMAGARLRLEPGRTNRNDTCRFCLWKPGTGTCWAKGGDAGVATSSACLLPTNHERKGKEANHEPHEPHETGPFPFSCGSWSMGTTHPVATTSTGAAPGRALQGACGAGSCACACSYSYSAEASKSKDRSFPRRCWGMKAAQRVTTQGETWAARALYIAPYHRPLTPALSRRERETRPLRGERPLRSTLSPIPARCSLSPRAFATPQRLRPRRRERARVRGPGKTTTCWSFFSGKE